MNTFPTLGFAHIKDAIPKPRCRELAREFKRFYKSGGTELDQQCPKSPSAYGTKFFDQLLQDFLPTMEKHTGKKLYPAYSYARIYVPGEELKPHTDRPSCEFSATITLKAKGRPWAIFMADVDPNGEDILFEWGETKKVGNVSQIIMDVGDAVIYKGTEKVHWREVYEGKKQYQVFLHYVDANGKYTSHKYDSRAAINTQVSTISAEVSGGGTSRTETELNLLSYIKVFNGVVPDDLCDAIVKEYKDSSKWKAAAVNGGEQATIAPEIRHVQEISMSDANIIAENPEVRAELDSGVFAGVAKIIENYRSAFPATNVVKDTGYQLLTYKKDQFYKEHTDSFAAEPRQLTASIALNDDFAGGSFSFFGGKYKYNIPKGSAIVFPSNFMYPHQIETVTSGERFAIVTWML